jgi:hypothetical protein
MQKGSLVKSNTEDGVMSQKSIAGHHELEEARKVPLLKAVEGVHNFRHLDLNFQPLDLRKDAFLLL